LVGLISSPYVASAKVSKLLRTGVYIESVFNLDVSVWNAMYNIKKKQFIFNVEQK